MPSILDFLTKVGVMDPATGQANFDIPEEGTKAAAKPLDIGTPPVLNPQTIHPSVQQAASIGATPGGVNAMSPGLTKAGKLATLLTSGLQGALAGRRASEEAVLASGGRRSGGAGMGFEAGFTLPWQRAQQLAQTQQAQSAAQLGQAGLQPIQTPYGNMPAALAPKLITPELTYRGKIGAAEIGAGAREKAAETAAAATTQAATTRAEASKDVARINQGGLIPLDANVAEMAGMPEMAGQPVGRGMLTNINKAIEAKGYRIQDMGKNGEDPNSGMWLMDRSGARLKQISPNSLTFQKAATYAQTRPVVVTDPNDPGYAYFAGGAEAIAKHLPSPQGAASVAAKTEARSEVPTKIGDQKVAFNTALQHADLLQNALTYLNDPKNPSNIRAWNSVKNRFKTEFGSSDVTNFNVIANAYTREVTKMLSGGHLTDSEISTQGATLPANASPAQILGALQSYRALAQSKLTVLNQQARSATAPRNRTPNAPATPTRTIVF